MGSLTSVQKTTKSILVPCAIMSLLSGILIFVYPLQLFLPYILYIAMIFGFCVGFFVLGSYVSYSLKSVTRFSPNPNPIENIVNKKPVETEKNVKSSTSTDNVTSPSGSIVTSAIQKSSESPKQTDPTPKKAEIAVSHREMKDAVPPTEHNVKSAEIQMNSSEFMAKIIKLGEIAKECEEMVEDESELSQKEKTKLYLKRDEFKKILLSIKATSRTAF